MPGNTRERSAHRADLPSRRLVLRDCAPAPRCLKSRQVSGLELRLVGGSIRFLSPPAKEWSGNKRLRYGASRPRRAGYSPRLPFPQKYPSPSPLTTIELGGTSVHGFFLLRKYPWTSPPSELFRRNDCGRSNPDFCLSDYVGKERRGLTMATDKPRPRAIAT